MDEKMPERKSSLEAKASPDGWQQWSVDAAQGFNTNDARREVVETDRQCPNGNTPEAKEVHATAKQLKEILVSQGYQCAFCECGLAPEDAEIDHITPRSDGGTNTPSNLQWLCRPCNRAKGSMSMAAFTAMMDRIAMKRRQG